MQQDVVCRGCLAVDGKFSSIHQLSTAQAYESLLGIPLMPSDELPDHVCSFCLRMLCRFAEFKVQCLKVLEVLRQVRMDGRVVTKEYSHSVTSSRPELKPRYVQTKTVTIEVFKQEAKDDVMDPTVPFTMDVEKEERLSENETEDNDFNEAVVIEPKLEDDDVKMKPYQVFVDDFSHIMKDKKKNHVKKIKKEVLKRKPFKAKDKVKKKVRVKTKRSKSDRQIVIDYAKSAGFNITFLTHEEQVREVEEKRSESVTTGRNCRQCGKHFDAPNALERHKKIYHVLKPDCFMCDICSCVFRNKRTLRSHMTSHGWVFTCLSCNFTTKHRPVLRKHQHFHEGKRFSCKYCGKEFTKTTSYFSHVRLKHALELSWCDLCGEFFISEKGVENHKKLTHNMVEEFPIECRECDKRFKSEAALERHTTVKGCNLPSCVQCGDAFAAECLLRYHLVQRHFADAAPDCFPCDRCGLRFYNPGALSRHWCGAACACAQCGARCDDVTRLADHVARTHHIFKCEECGKQFTSSAYFKRHYSLAHAGRSSRPRGRPRADPGQRGQHKKYPLPLSAVRRWRVVGERGLAVDREGRAERDDAPVCGVCETCGDTFRSAPELRSHQHSAHAARDRFACARCGKGFKQRAQLLMHERVHTGERPYACPDCPKAFKTYQAYSRHYLIHSGVRKHVCQLCEKSFQTSTAVKMHIKSVHMKLPAPPRVRNRRCKE